MGAFLGIDTSNYTTSSAVYFGIDKPPVNVKRLLPVKDGECGLRQSDAVFLHTKSIEEIICTALSACNERIEAIGVSVKPRDVEDSYMPCFLVGKSHAGVLSKALNVPVYEFSHQAGHIMACVQDTGDFSLLESDFIAFHVSGGTTEALLVSPSEDNIISTKIIGETLDLNAGQTIDRVGKMLGLSFPAGKELDALSLNGEIKVKSIHPSVKGNNCCLSGVVNLCENMLIKGESNENIARFCIEYIKLTVDKMTENILNEYGDLPLVYAGGVMSNSIVSKYLTEKYNARFASPASSCDNAIGVATLASFKHNLKK